MAQVPVSLFSAARSRRSLPQARRRRALALEGLEPRIVLTQIQYGLFDTGVDNSGNALPGGASDTHYTLPVTQLGTAGMNAVVASTLAGGWVGDGPTHAWIAPTADQGGAAGQSTPAGTYEYETTFTVPTNSNYTGTIKGILSGQVASDNNITDILIDGVSTGFTSTSLSTLGAFTVQGTVVTGVNTVDIIVANTATGPSGLHLDNLLLALPPALSVDQATVNVAYGGTATNTGSFSTPNPNDTVSISSSLGTVTQTGTNSGTYTFSDPNVTAGTSITITATNSEGGITNTTFTITETPPSLTGSNQPITVRAGGAAVTVDPNITLNDPSGPNLSSASVSIGTNFTAAEDQLLFTDQNGITGAYNSSTGILTLSGSATPAQYQTALQSVQYQDTNTNAATANQAARTISFSISPGTYNPDNGHFYQFFKNPGITWTAAKAAADASSVYGLKGYLATLTSAAENTFAFSKTLSTGWIGASDAANPGVWEWADGPETGLQFWSGIRNGSPVNGQYNDWNTGEPNDSGGIEFYAQYLQSGLWNDLANTSVVQGYLVEYGGSAGDPTLQLTSQATANVTSITNTPVVTGPLLPTSMNAPNTTITGTADAGSLVKIYNDVNNNGTIDLGETVIGSEQLGAGQTTFSIAVPLTQNAANYFIATATTSPAAESTPIAIPTITTDSIPPVRPLVTGPAAAVSMNAASVTITGTAEVGSLVQVYADTNNDGLIDGGDTLVSSQQLAANASAFSIPTALTQDAANHFLVAATDAAGNRSAPSIVPTVNDTTALPALPIAGTPSAATTVNTGTYTVTGTAEAGSLIKVYGDGNGNGTIDDGEVVVGFLQLAPGQTNYSIAVPLTPNSANHFLVTATNAAGNQSPPLILPTITQDSTVPALPTVTSPTTAMAVNAGATTITGTAEANSLVRIYKDFNGNGVIDIGDAVVGFEQLTGGATTYSITVPLAQNSANNFLATATDAGGNQSAPIAVPTVTADSTPPGFPIGVSPAVAATVGLRTYTLTGTAEPGSLVQVYADTNGNGSIDDGETVAGYEHLAPDQTTYSITVTLATNAANHFLITATDAAGNQSVAVAAPTITQDSIAPVIPTNGLPSAATTVNTGTYTVTGTAEAGSLVKVYADANGNGTIDDGEVAVGFLQLAPGQTNYSIKVPLTPNAANHFLVTATDLSGNRSAPLVLPTITQDSTVPDLPIAGNPSAPTSVSTGTYTLTGTAEAGSLVKVFADANGNGKVDDGEQVVGFVQLAPGQTNYSVTVPLVANSANHFIVSATDAAGNQSAGLVLPTVTADSTPPALPVAGNPSAPTSVSTGTYTLTGTAEAGSLVKVYADANGNGTIDDGEVVVGFLQLAPGQTDYSITVPLIPNAANKFLVTATDAAGNLSSTLILPTITQDSTIPVPPVDVTLPVSTTTTATSYTLTGTAEAGSLVRVYADLNGDGSVDDGEMVVGTIQLAPGQTSYSVTVPLTANATNNFLVTATDAAGNQSGTMVVPVITQQSSVQGIVFLDRNANGTLDAGETGLAGRVVYLDLDGSGTFKAGDPTATTDASGHFSFSTAGVGSSPVREDTTQDSSDRYVVDQITTNSDGSVSIAAVPFSAITPMPILPNPFAGNTGTDANSNYVQSLYKAILGRTGGDDEIAGWTAAMAGGMTTEQVAAGINNSPEHRTDQVAAYYAEFLHRATDPVSQGWVADLMNGMSEQAVVEGILNSPEYLASHTDPSLLVRDLYLDVLGRQGSDDELASGQAALASGMSAAAYIATFVEGSEANDQIVEDLYTAGLHRDREPGTSDLWTTMLAASDSASDITTGILSSDEFRQNAKVTLA